MTQQFLGLRCAGTFIPSMLYLGCILSRHGLWVCMARPLFMDSGLSQNSRKKRARQVRQLSGMPLVETARLSSVARFCVVGLI
jgi:hypothetical protein